MTEPVRLSRRGLLVGLLSIPIVRRLPKLKTKRELAEERIQALAKALEAGGYNAAPSDLVQGSALWIEDLSPVMECVTFDDSSIRFQPQSPGGEC